MYLLTLLYQCYFAGDLTEQEQWIGSLLLKQIQLLQFNAHEVSYLQMMRPDSIETAKSVFLGAAVYPTVALFNHSCEPGIVRYETFINLILNSLSIK